MKNHPPGPTRILTTAELKAIGMPRKSDRFPPLAPPDVSDDDHGGNAGCLVVALLAVAVGSLIFLAAWKGLGLW